MHADRAHATKPSPVLANPVCARQVFLDSCKPKKEEGEKKFFGLF